MKFLRETKAALIWLVQVQRYFFSLRFWLTANVVAYAFIGKIARIFAFILPFKVLTLAASDGVPLYFRSIVERNDKSMAILGFSILAILTFALSVFCETMNRRLAEKGSEALMASAAGLSVISNQRVEVKTYYARVTSLTASVMFVAIGLSIVTWLEPQLAAALVVIALCGLLFTALAVRPRRDHTKTRLGVYIRDHKSSYIGVISAIAVFTTFLALLIPMLMGLHAHILYAMVTFMLMRQTLGAATNSVKEVTNLWQVRHIVDALIYPDRHLKRNNEAEKGGLQELFSKKARERKLAAELEGIAGDIDMRWQDSTLRAAHVFMAKIVPEDGGPVRHVEQHVYLARITRLLENEEMLFQHISRQEVFAAELLTRYSYGTFECAVYDAGIGQAPPLAAWRGIQKTFHLRICALQPPKSLVSTFRSSFPLLGDRLNSGLVERMEVAVENGADRALLGRLRQLLPSIQAQLEQMPLCIANPDFKYSAITATAVGGFQVMSWGDWALEPFGASLYGVVDERAVQEYIDHALKSRADFSAAITVRHVQFVWDCVKLETAITRSNFRAAFALLESVFAGLQALEADQRELLSA